MVVASRPRTSAPRMSARLRSSIGPTARQPESTAYEPHQVIRRESVRIELIGAQGPSTKKLDVDVRIAVEHFEGAPMLAVTLAQDSNVIVYWPAGESADVLEVFRLFRLIVGMKKIKMNHLPNLLRYIRNGSLPSGKRMKTLRRHIGKTFEKAVAYIPTPKEVLGIMIPCREHAIVPDTASLTALAAEGRFEVTAELKAQGVMDAESHKARSIKIDQRFNEMRPQVEVMCTALDIALDEHVDSLVREMIGYGVDVKLACAYIAATSIAAMPLLGFRAYSPVLGHVIAFEDVDPVAAGLAVASEAFQWDARVQQNVERQLFGLIHQNNTNSLREVETELL